jgi:hypothetical protein
MSATFRVFSVRRCLFLWIVVACVQQCTAAHKRKRTAPNVGDKGSSRPRDNANRPVAGRKARPAQTQHVLSWNPYIVLVRNFLTEDECVQLIRTARPHLTSAGVGTDTIKHGTANAASVKTVIRDSSAMSFTPAQVQ